MCCLVGETRANPGDPKDPHACRKRRGISKDHGCGEFVKTSSEPAKSSFFPTGRQCLRWWIGLVEWVRPREVQITLLLAGVAGFFGAVGSLAFRRATEIVHWLLNDFLTTVFERFSRHDDERLPVVAPDGSKRLLGAVSKADALLAFAEQPKGPVS